MNEFAERLARKTHKELIYVRGMERMHRERYLASFDALRRARFARDSERRSAILGDLRTYHDEMWQLFERHRGIYARALALRRNVPLLPSPGGPRSPFADHDAGFEESSADSSSGASKP